MAVIDEGIVINQWINGYKEANSDIFNFKIIKPEVVPWVESNIYLPRTSSEYDGPYSYDLTPYWKEPISHLHPNSPVRTVSIMKCVQSGATEGVIIPGICYTISEDPCSILLTAGDLTLAKDTVEKRIDPVLHESGLTHLLRPHVVKKTNNKSGDTAASKEFIGGSFYARGTQSATTFRQFPAKKVFADDYDAAPRELGNEGTPRGLIEGRQNSYGDKAKSFFISTPTVTQISNINDLYLLGTQKTWHWPCRHCGKYMPIQFKIEREDGSIAGIVYQQDTKGRLKIDSVAYMCPYCSNLHLEKEKFDLNINGIWLSNTDDPIERFHESYHFCGLALPPGFTGWVKIIEEFIQAHPLGKSNPKLLKSWNNLRMGLPFSESGKVLKVNDLMKNTCEYHPGIIPDSSCSKNQNGQIIMITLSCDINGIMNKDIEDVRLDWEVLAHTSRGVTYSIDHGSIGTFKRSREKKRKEIENDDDRVKFTLRHKASNSVWPHFEKIVKKEFQLESNAGVRGIDITVVDTGFGEKYAMEFVRGMSDNFVYGVKGHEEGNFRKIDKDTVPVFRSKEDPKSLYIVEVNQVKDDLSQFMELLPGDDGSQPSGFMNFPQPRDGKYTYKSFYSQYEGEERTEVFNNDQLIGYKWKKKNNSSINHFWDVRVYGLIAPLIYLDLFKQSDVKYRNITWDEFVMLITS